MIFRFRGQIPQGRFEFTCECGKWNAVEIVFPGKVFVAFPDKKFNCADCKREVRVWQQMTHWHLSVGESK
jgi:hypothetical protein